MVHVSDNIKSHNHHFSEWQQLRRDTFRGTSAAAASESSTNYVGCTIRGPVGCILLARANFSSPLENDNSTRDLFSSVSFLPLNDCAVVRKDLLANMLLLGSLLLSDDAGSPQELERSGLSNLLNKWVRNGSSSCRSPLSASTVNYVLSAARELQSSATNFYGDNEINSSSHLALNAVDDVLNVTALLATLARVRNAYLLDPVLASEVGAVASQQIVNSLISMGNKQQVPGVCLQRPTYMMFENIFIHSLRAAHDVSAASKLIKTVDLQSTSRDTAETVTGSSNALSCILSPLNVSSVYGPDVAEELARLRVLVCGSGAIGCEILKLLSQLNVGAYTSSTDAAEEVPEADGSDSYLDDAPNDMLYTEQFAGSLSVPRWAPRPFYDLCRRFGRRFFRKRRQVSSHGHSRRSSNEKPTIISEKGADGRVIVVDNDIIELSNVHRQFLFQPADVHASKAITATNKVKAAHVARGRISGDLKSINVFPLNAKLGPETEHSFLNTHLPAPRRRRNNGGDGRDDIICSDSAAHEDIETIDDIFATTDAVLIALDNVEARNYVDRQCIKHTYIGHGQSELGSSTDGRRPSHRVHLIDAGTIGTKASVQTIVPLLTETYTTNGDTYAQTREQIPVCTIRSFPTHIDHCIIWAKELFVDKFQSEVTGTLRRVDILIRRLLTKPSNSDSETLAQWLTDEVAALELTRTELTTIDSFLRYLVNLLTQPHQSVYHLCLWGVREFRTQFVENIRHIYAQHPLDSLDEDGAPFWSRYYTACVLLCNPAFDK
jgi:molybdopterin/thiamine biosynthesis adenylyltransferase